MSEGCKSALLSLKRRQLAGPGRVEAGNGEDGPSTAIRFRRAWRLIVPLVALGLMALEYLYGRLRHVDAYDARETAASWVIAVGNKLMRVVSAGVVAVPFLWVWEHRLFDIPLDQIWALAALVLGVEFFYYWHHRRDAPGEMAVGDPWRAPLGDAHEFQRGDQARLGRRPDRRVPVLSAARLARLPSGWHRRGARHRPALSVLPAHDPGAAPRAARVGVQHACGTIVCTTRPTTACLDKNFGSLLIVYDRLFGTFAEAPKGEPLRFGLKNKDVVPHRPFAIILAGWLDIVRGLERAATWRGRFEAVFGRP